MKLTEHFKLEEFNAEPHPRHIQNYLTLSLFCLEKIREKFGPVTITSGYRSKEHNDTLTGSSKTSQHVTGEACDFFVAGADKYKVYDFVCKELKWPGQVFVYAKKGHLHVGLPRLDLKPTHKIMEA